MTFSFHRQYGRNPLIEKFVLSSPSNQLVPLRRIPPPYMLSIFSSPMPSCFTFSFRYVITHSQPFPLRSLASFPFLSNFQPVRVPQGQLYNAW
ncbi:hypothetical protein GALMADRAFT_258416 [Galerina marginata CBS 339.88]|uniref:Uncharacterized protein n=1 Tax=Galerina marginata (strain CBS 339.88) TaxID=685588 RepID=A0A067S8N7_GALM3|nr:hypothetical protein GALMADRAFT_258416 [Galerina marginata CBS 339.88]